MGTFDSAVSTDARAHVDRTWLAKVLLATLATTAVLIFLYNVIPIGQLSNGWVLGRLVISMLIFVAVVASKVRAILRSDRPAAREKGAGFVDTLVVTASPA